MSSASDPRHPLVSLFDELTRLSRRLEAMWADAYLVAGLRRSEIIVLKAVVEADRPPTAPQIARSHGLPRQTVQLAISSLVSSGLVAPEPNPDHRRAMLLRATADGIALKNRVDERGVALADEFLAGIQAKEVRETAKSLRKMRKAVEFQMKADGLKDGRSAGGFAEQPRVL